MKFGTYVLFRWVAVLARLDRIGVTRTELRYLAVTLISFVAGASLFC